MLRITRTPSNSMAGLRVKIAAAIETNDDLWDVPMNDLDFDKEAVRSLIEAAIPSEQSDTPKEGTPPLRLDRTELKRGPPRR